jgi:Dolichyl-phosphate-mannose-protein mannosyltransferase
VVERQDAKSEVSAAGPKTPPGILLILLLVSLPLVNPWVRGDGVGYYAFARALLTQRNLDFVPDYQHANPGFRAARLDSLGMPRQEFRTATGHLDNHFSVGPAMLWAPFLVCAHAGVLLARASGAHVSADGFSLPYLLAMAIGTLLYGFLALLLSYRVACRFVPERWALFATIAIWWASSLPVYMYFNPSWSHAHSAFAVALFAWYWLHTGEKRKVGQWFVLALLAGLMMNVYYPNAIVLVVLVPEALRQYRAAWIRSDGEKFLAIRPLVRSHALFCLIVLASLLPTFLSRYFVYGGFLKTGYIPVSEWAWSSPWFLALLFSANHGLFSWTPILLIATIGLFLFWRRVPAIGASVLYALLVFYYFMASYPDWPGISSYGNRFFVSLTVFFVLGLAVALDALGRRFRSQRAASAWFAAVLGVFIVWNLGLIFQWGAHLIPARGAVSWREVAYNQVHVVPRQIVSQLHSYLFRRKDTLHQIEQRDIQELRRTQQP